MSSAPIPVASVDPGELDARVDVMNSAGSRVTVIEPRKGVRLVNLREIWAYRELLYFLTWRDIKVQYKQTVLGPLWAILRPVINLVIFSVVFGQMLRVPSDGSPYPLFAFAAILPWTFFSSAVTASSGSLLNHAYLLAKIYFPRVLLPTASIGSGLVTLAINFVIYIGLLLFYGQRVGLSILLVPLLILLTCMMALGVGYLLSGLTVVYRDIRFLVSSFVSAWMYLSPVIYPVSEVPGQFRWLMSVNPMTGIISGFRSALLDQAVDWSSLGYSACFTLVVFVVGLFVFHLTERRVADVA